MELKVTKEKVLEAAKDCPSAEGVLKTLFPEAFKKEVLRLVIDRSNDVVRDQNGHIVLDFSFFGASGKASLRQGSFSYRIDGDKLVVTRK